MIEAGIDGLSRGNNLVDMIRGLNRLHFVLLDQGALARLAKLESWIRNWWGDDLNSLSVRDWFEYKGDNMLWSPHLDAAETALEILLGSRL